MECREAFERWHDDPVYPGDAIRRNSASPEHYELPRAKIAWAAWQAAWDARAMYCAPSGGCDGDQDGEEAYSEGKDL